jgi:hypothetical protein
MTLNYIHVADPQRPVYEMWVDGQKMADLVEPAYEEMFWCSYKLIPVNPLCGERLRDYDMWNECRFDLREPTTGRVFDVSLAGGYSFQEYCHSRTDRVDFRSLWPPNERIENRSRFAKFIDWILSRLSFLFK